MWNVEKRKLITEPDMNVCSRITGKVLAVDLCTDDTQETYALSC